MNSISLTSYTLNWEDRKRLDYTLKESGFRISASPEGEIIKDAEKNRFNYALIFRTKVVLLDERSEKDPEFKTRSSELKDILDAF